MALETSKMIAEKAIEIIRETAIDDPEAASELERGLYRSFIAGIFNGPDKELAELAKIVLKAQNIEFPRW